MAENLILLPNEQIISTFKGFNLTNKRVFTYSNKTFDCLLLESIDSIHYVKKDYKLLLVLSIISLFLSFTQVGDFRIIGFFIAIGFFVAYFVTLKEALKINSCNSYIYILASGNNMSEMNKFVNEIITQMEML